MGPTKEDIVIVIKKDGQYYCLQGKCSHFRVRMAAGVLINDKILCNCHGAGFSIKTGYPE